MDEPKVKRIPKADIEAMRAEQEIRRAVGQLRVHVPKFREKVEIGLREIVKEMAKT